MAGPLKKGSTSCACGWWEAEVWDAARAEVQSGWAKAELNGSTVQQLAWVS